MATSVSVTSAYAGEFAGKYVAAALLSGLTLEQGALTVLPNIPYSHTIKKDVSSGFVDDASCDFTDEGSIALTDRVLTPKELQVNLELCKQDFIDDWEAVQMGYSPMSRNMPPKFSDYIIARTLAMVAAATETSIWQGVAATAGEFAGFIPAFVADGDINDVSTPVTLSAANIVAQVGRLVDDIPTAVYGKEDLRLYVPTSVVRFYTRAMSALGYMDRYYEGAKPLDFEGIPMVHCPGMPDDTMVAAQISNLYFGTGLMRDQNEVKVLDMADLDGSQNVRVIMRYTAGVQYGIGTDIVLYGTG